MYAMYKVKKICANYTKQEFSGRAKINFEIGKKKITIKAFEIL